LVYFYAEEKREHVEGIYILKKVDLMSLQAWMKINFMMMVVQTVEVLSLTEMHV
jgi:hypothetical protein